MPCFPLSSRKQCARHIRYIFFYKQSIFDTRPENSLSFAKKPPQKIVEMTRQVDDAITSVTDRLASLLIDN